MDRPYVNISKYNIQDELIKHLEGMIPKFKTLPGVMGITLNGGLSRGYADHLSEVDLTFYIKGEEYPAWTKKKAPIPLHITKFDNVLYDIKIINFQEEDQRHYGDVELWDLSYAKILYDPQKKIEELFKKKLATKPDITKADDLLWEAYWNFKLAGDIWMNRGDVLQGHFVLNESIKPLLKALYIANGEHIPHEKWLVHMSHTLKWKPSNYEEKLVRIFNVEHHGIDSLKHRQLAINDLYHEIDDYIKTEHHLGFKLACHQKYAYDLLKCLVEKENISIDEWKELSSIALLNTDPFYSITEIHEGRLILSIEGLLSIKPEDMYPGFYEVVEAVITDLKLEKSNY